MNRNQLVITIRNYAIPKLVLEIVASPRAFSCLLHVKIRDRLGEKIILPLSRVHTPDRCFFLCTWLGQAHRDVEKERFV